MYSEGDYDLAGFSVGAVERGRLLPKTGMISDDVILGVSSNGLHSNGYSLVRHIIANANLNYGETASFDGTRTLGEALLDPTRIYVKPVLEALKHHCDITAIAHITGGGLIENIPRVLPADFYAEIDLGTFTPPPVFKWLSEVGNIDTTEMLRTFNCGIGMILCCGQEDVAKITKIFEDHGEKIQPIGTLQKQDDGDQSEQVRFSGDLLF